MLNIFEYDGKYEITGRTTLSGSIIDIDDAKAFARIDDTSLSGFDSQNDIIISGLIDASVELFEQYTGRYLTPASVISSYSLNQSFYSVNIALPFSDINVTAVNVYDVDDVAYTVTSANYDINARTGTIDVYDTSIPTNLRRFNNLVVSYESGMFDTNEEVTDDIKTALKQNISHWYENRQSISDVSMTDVPNSAMSTFNRFRKRII